ncbi:PssE/Cps14G family polysaccharide biosynthesis glycosyltransferase [Bifidobacterium eulemuris]|uniref:Glycosyltransferase family 28 C-terminal domain protein n=1 Tax=Bifidobacterium eulemuris TaxID=1765219 RepID=A0A261GAV8_9BIFI|nr:PssE/Cps14G family polysaccharide biosynthesis glycosyltransferase [Bifidobacterium eulemuris]OZG68544.1 glycosyltransferase family 28 C-terminal domain protein [Bifidobacterium eulemuris]QOL32674.1 hypothetical protein BE0216_09675 [Bifidobacterium eulemuris]
MIFVSVGTQKFQFNRLIQSIDDFVRDGKIQDEVVMQTGYSSYLPRLIESHKFFSPEKFDTYIDDCDVLVTHGGVGTIVKGLKANKPVVVVPRLEQFREHVDNHQIEIADAFAAKNYILKCIDVNSLPSLLYVAETHSFERYVSQQGKAIDVIEKFLTSSNQKER